MSDSINLHFTVDLAEHAAYYANYISSLKKQLMKKLILYSPLLVLFSLVAYYKGDKIYLCLSVIIAIFIVFYIKDHFRLTRNQKIFQSKLIANEPRQIEISNDIFTIQTPKSQSQLPMSALNNLEFMQDMLVLTFFINKKAFYFVIYSNAFKEISRDDLVQKINDMMRRENSF